MLSRFVDLRAGEGRPLLSMCAILALVTGAHTILETARDTLFLSKLPPDRLAWVYVLLAFLSLVAGALSSAISKRFGRRAGFVVTLGLCAYAIVLLHLREPTPVMVFVLYVASGVMGTILTLQFWLFAGQMFTVSQGKRLFGPLAAGGVLGATLGATAAALLLRVTTPLTLLLGGSGLFLTAAFIATLIPASEGIDDTDASPVRAFAWLRDVSLLRSDRYVALTGALIAISTATVLLADFLFKSTAARELGPDRLGPFLGTYYAVQNGLALIVQVVISGWLVRRLGVTSTLLIFPLLMTGGGVGVALSGGFGMALTVKATDGSLRHSLHRVTTELLLLPLPAEIRDRAKRLIDTMLGRGAQAVAATLIVVLSAFSVADSRTLGMIVAALALAWVVVALALRGPYLDVFRRALARGELPGDDQELDLAAVETLLESLASAEEAQVVAAIELLAATRRRRLLPALILYHESPTVLARALEVFSAEPRRDFVPLAERLLGHTDPHVRASAVRALAAAGKRDAAERALDDAHPDVRAYAAYFLAVDADDPHQDERIAAMLVQKDEDGAALRRALLSVIGEHGDEHWGEVVKRIVERDGARRPLGAIAAPAIRRTRELRLAGYLVDQLASRDGREIVRDALVSLGSVGFAALKKAISDQQLPPRARRQLPRAVASFGTQEGLDLLIECIEREQNPQVAARMLRALGRMSSDAKNGVVGKLKFDRARFEKHTRRCLSEYLDLFEVVVALDAGGETRTADDHPVSGVLVGLLRDRSDSALERSFRFLQLAHRNEDIEGVHLAVTGGDRRSRSTALEFLDVLTLGESDMRSLLRVVVDDLEPAERVRRAKPLYAPDKDAPLTHDQAVKRLIHDEDQLIAALAAAYAAEAGLPALVSEAREELRRRPELGRMGVAELAPMMELSHA